MSRQAQQREGEAFVVEDATVVLTDGATSVVRTRLGDLRARRAASCLVDPMPKDRVLVALSGDEVFILAVLVRAGEAPVRLSSDESVEIVSRKGTVSILAQEGVTVASAKAVEISGAELGVHAERARVALAELGFVGKLVDVSVSPPSGSSARPAASSSASGAPTASSRRRSSCAPRRSICARRATSRCARITRSCSRARS